MGWIGFVLTVIVGIVAYFLRKNYRRFYGVGEIAVGVGLMYLAWFPTPYMQSVGLESVAHQILVRLVQIIVGIYAFVQGLENRRVAR
jgi:hypothetical protein